MHWGRSWKRSPGSGEGFFGVILRLERGEDVVFVQQKTGIAKIEELAGQSELALMAMHFADDGWMELAQDLGCALKNFPFGAFHVALDEVWNRMLGAILV